jgi:hypothetical protein
LRLCTQIPILLVNSCRSWDLRAYDFAAKGLRIRLCNPCMVDFGCMVDCLGAAAGAGATCCLPAKGLRRRPLTRCMVDCLGAAAGGAAGVTGGAAGTGCCWPLMCSTCTRVHVACAHIHVCVCVGWLACLDACSCSRDRPRPWGRPSGRCHQGLLCSDFALLLPGGVQS